MNEPPVLILVCSCGKRVKAVGATPGRLGRCPDCGGLLRVPEVFDPVVAPPPSPKPPADSPRDDDRLDFRTVSDRRTVERRERLARARTEKKTVGSGWVFTPPKTAETSLGVSLLYPFWDWAGLGLLAFTPLILAGLSFLLINLSGYLLFLNFFTGPAYVLFIGASFALAVILGHTCRHLGLFLIESCSGSPAHPGRPDFETFESLVFLGRWMWAGVLGLVLGGGTAILYVIGNGGVVRLQDRLAIAFLSALWAIAGPLALLATTLFDSIGAAGPGTVLGALFRLKTAYVRPGLVAAGSIALICFWSSYVLETESVVAQAIGLWGLWLFALSAALVSIRVLGLCHFRHADRAGWIRSRD